LVASSIYAERFGAARCCVLIPTYNNAGTLHAVLAGVSSYTHDICVVVDGSTDVTMEILRAFPFLKIQAYSPNQGKGWALRQGFAFARAHGYDYAITIDSDGQHYPDDLPVLLDALLEQPDTLYIGARNMNQSTVPGKSSFGNRFSNFWYRVETGLDLPDTQSGYRVYPLRRLEGMAFYTRRFEFEIEVIVRAAWAGIPVRPVPVRVYYAPAGERVSHFRPWQDFTRISILNTVLVFISLVYIKPRDFFRLLTQQNLGTILQEHLIKPQEGTWVKAASVGVGVFMGIAPFWGFQLVLVFAVAALCRLNKGIAIIASNISIPPMIPLILYSSYKMGQLVVGQGTDTSGRPWLQAIQSKLILTLHKLAIADSQIIDAISHSLWQYLVGSLVLATLMGILSAALTYLLVTIYKRKNNPA
jgi:glycosyltransferase involved in cell wall biosynthesis